MNDTEPNALQQDTIDNIEDFEDLALSTYLKVRRLVGGDHPVTRRVSLAHTIMENAHSVQRAIPDPRVLDKSLMDAPPSNGCRRSPRKRRAGNELRPSEKTRSANDAKPRPRTSPGGVTHGVIVSGQKPDHADEDDRDRCASFEYVDRPHIRKRHRKKGRRFDRGDRGRPRDQSVYFRH
ncbi:MAG: hypothetical protein ISN28_07275 [Ectothiorhodospiraceae bacterium AqS1]|nr:hypothetical protein [Ectothiorhodospiraceae bacterium AqS1]